MEVIMFQIHTHKKSEFQDQGWYFTILNKTKTNNKFNLIQIKSVCMTGL